MTKPIIISLFFFSIITLPISALAFPVSTDDASIFESLTIEDLEFIMADKKWNCTKETTWGGCKVHCNDGKTSVTFSKCDDDWCDDAPVDPTYDDADDNCKKRKKHKNTYVE